MTADLRYLCKGLRAMGVEEEELIRITSKHDVSSLSRPGTKAHTTLEIAKFFGGLIAGAGIGSLIGYYTSKSGEGAIIGSLIGACIGIVGQNDGEERSTSEHWMKQELKHTYPHLMKELEKNEHYYRHIL